MRLRALRMDAKRRSMALAIAITTVRRRRFGTVVSKTQRNAIRYRDLHQDIDQGGKQRDTDLDGVVFEGSRTTRADGMKHKRHE